MTPDLSLFLAMWVPAVLFVFVFGFVMSLGNVWIQLAED